MDARVYFHLVDAIADASSVAELSTVRNMIDGADMHPKEREALGRAFQARERSLRGSDTEVLKPPAERAD
jgi:hypothetical protein